MKQTLQDLRAFERVFLLDRLHERFLLGSSSWNAKQKRVLTRIAIVLAISLLFGVPMTTLNRAYGKVGRYLTKKGVATEGVIAEKQIDDQGEAGILAPWSMNSKHLQEQLRKRQTAPSDASKRFLTNSVIIQEPVSES